MKAKSNLKAVETVQAERGNYTSDQVWDMANHLYYVEAVLDILMYAGDTPSDINGGSISVVAGEAKRRVQNVLNILEP